MFDCLMIRYLYLLDVWIFALSTENFFVMIILCCHTFFQIYYCIGRRRSSIETQIALSAYCEKETASLGILIQRWHFSCEKPYAVECHEHVSLSHNAMIFLHNSQNNKFGKCRCYHIQIAFWSHELFINLRQNMIWYVALFLINFGMLPCV